MFHKLMVLALCTCVCVFVCLFLHKTKVCLALLSFNSWNFVKMLYSKVMLSHLCMVAVSRSLTVILTCFSHSKGFKVA